MKLNSFFKILPLVSAFIFFACGENDIVVDDPNHLNPNVPMVDVEPDDYIQEHLREYDDGETVISLADDVKLLTPYQLENLIEYDEENDILYFDENAEIDRLPQSDDRIIYSPYTIGMIDEIPGGVIGEVDYLEEVTTRAQGRRAIALHFKDVEPDLDDYFNDMKFTDVPVVVRRKVNSGNSSGYQPYELELFDLGTKLKKEFLEDFPVNAGLEFNGVGKIIVKGYVSVDKKRKFFDFELETIARINGDLELYAEYELGYDQWHGHMVDLPVIPYIQAGAVPIPLSLNISADFYSILDAKCSIGAGISFDTSLYKTRIGYDNGRLLTPNDNHLLTESSNFSWNMNLINFSGSAGIGFRLSPAIKFNKITILKGDDTAHADITLTLNSETQVNLDPSKSTSPFNNDPFQVNLTAGFTIENIFDCFNKRNIKNEVGPSRTFTLAELYLYPEYERWRHEDDVENGTTVISAVPTGDLLLPVTPGFSLYEVDLYNPDDLSKGVLQENLVKGSTYHSWWERFTQPNNGTRYSSTFTGLKAGHTYTVVPHLGFFNDLLKTYGYNTPHYTFTFGEEDEEEVRRISHISYPEIPGFTDGGIAYFTYDDQGRLVRYIDPFLEVNATFDYAGNKIVFNFDDYYTWSDLKTNSNGNLISAYASGEGPVYFYYDNDGYITSIKSPETTDTFVWEDGKLLRLTHEQQEKSYTDIYEVTFTYDKEIKSEHGQLCFFGNLYSFMMRGDLLGKHPKYLPSGATMRETDDEGTQKVSYGISYEFDSEGYIIREILNLMGIFNLPFTYFYE
ncbi:MAG: DUF4595 domain-containing protein [Muribaculaceae bacterium]|nr:DUF4595 domain-containing protein [Muribaculaceae bacterium]